MRVGVHCSIRNGFAGAAQEAASLGCDTFQIFTQSPRGWKTRVYLDEEFTAFRAAREKLGLNPVVVHAPYLPNLCTSNPHLYKQSVDSLREDLRRCEKLGAEYLVIHPGAYSPDEDFSSGSKRLVSALNSVLDEIKGNSMILIENMAGGGRRVGATTAELKEILNGVKDENRVGVCFDTCHALAAGFNLTDKTGVNETLAEFDQAIGLERIRVFHVNDSKGVRGSQRDLHEHIGKGHVGEAGFRYLFSHTELAGRALILETPKDPAPSSDLENLRRLRACLPQGVKSQLAH